MARRKRFVGSVAIPRPVFELARWVCADYKRRVQAIESGSITGDRLLRYTELNAAVESALSEVEAGLREEILEDLAKGRGYNFSDTREIIYKDGYYARKKRLLYEVAKNLSLL